MNIKSAVILLLISFTYSAFSQVDQAKTAAKWKDGKYTKWKVDREASSLSLIRDSKQEITFTKKDGAVTAINWGRDSYAPYTGEGKSKVLYFQGPRYCFYVTEKSIVIFSPRNIRNGIFGVIGDKVSAGIKDEISAHIRGKKVVKEEPIASREPDRSEDNDSQPTTSTSTSTKPSSKISTIEKERKRAYVTIAPDEERIKTSKTINSFKNQDYKGLNKISQKDMAENFPKESIKYSKGYGEEDGKLVYTRSEQEIAINKDEVNIKFNYPAYVSHKNLYYKNQRSNNYSAVILLGNLIYNLTRFSGIDDEKFKIRTVYAKNNDIRLIKSLSLEEHKDNIRAYLNYRVNQNANIASMKLNFVSTDGKPLTSNSKFKIDITTIMKDESEEKLETFGGTIAPSDYTYDVSGAIGGSIKNNFTWTVDYCRCDNEKQTLYIEISPSTGKFSHSEKIKVPCIPNPMYQKSILPLFQKFKEEAYSAPFTTINTEHSEVQYKREECVMAYANLIKNLKKSKNGQVICRKNGKKGKVGMLNKELDIMLPFIYDYITRADNSLLITKDEKVGLSTIEGKIVLAPYYDDIDEHAEGFFGVKKDKKWGFINKKGEVVIPLNYLYVKKFSNGFASVKIEKNIYTYINTSGKRITEKTFTEAQNFKKETAKVVLEGGERGILSPDGSYRKYHWESDEEYAERKRREKEEEKARREGSSTSSSSSSRTSSSSSASENTTITIINDLSSSQNSKYGDVKIVFDGGSANSKSLSKSHDCEIDCKKVRGVYVGDRNSSNKGRLLFKTDSKCGKTVKLSSVW
jgi:hypothetical protein